MFWDSGSIQRILLVAHHKGTSGGPLAAAVTPIDCGKTAQRMLDKMELLRAGNNRYEFKFSFTSGSAVWYQLSNHQSICFIFIFKSRIKQLLPRLQGDQVNWWFWRSLCLVIAPEHLSNLIKVKCFPIMMWRLLLGCGLLWGSCWMGKETINRHIVRSMGSKSLYLPWKRHRQGHWLNLRIGS